jgi:two-component system chemotaxis response regulator CheB
MKKIRVLVIDDSAYSRRTITKMLDELPEVEVVGYATNGEEGIRRIIDLKPDLVTLDLEMPVMDGFTLLRIIMNSCPLPVIVISARNDDERVFKALELGAVDFIAKPGGAISVELINIREDLQNKVRSILSLNMETIRRRGSLAAEEAVAAPPGMVISKNATGKTEVDLVAIGSSTGGPPALQKIFTDFPKAISFAVMVSQHMPGGFTKAFAERLNRLCPFPIKEAAQGDRVVPGQVYIAPGGFNMQVEMVQGEHVIQLTEPSAKDRYVPSVDVMFTSLAKVYGSRLLAVVLTGMGNDGSLGVRDVKKAGGVVVAESEESAIVFGMPREVIASGTVDKVVHLDMMASEILQLSGVKRG